MEWIYIVGLIGYYLYRAYTKGMEKASNNKKPIQKVGPVSKDKSFEEILRELVENAENKQKEATKPIVEKQPKSQPLPKVQTKPQAKQKPITPKVQKREEPILHQHETFGESIEYDSNIEKIFHRRFDSVEEQHGSHTRASEIETYITDKHTHSKFVGLIVDGKKLSLKEMLIAQTVLERRF